MRIKDGFIKRKVAGKDIVVALGKNTAEFNKMLTLNETASFIFDLLTEDCTEEDIVRALADTYEDVDEELIKSDVSAFVAKLRETGVLID